MEFDLRGFETISANKERPLLSIAGSDLTFARSAVEALGRPAYVHLLINEKERLLAVSPCEADSDSISFYKEKASGLLAVRITLKHVLERVTVLVQGGVGDQRWRVNGTCYDGPVLVFDFNKAYRAE